MPNTFRGTASHGRKVALLGYTLGAIFRYVVVSPKRAFAGLTGIFPF
jgi:hypothetical protein